MNGGFVKIYGTILTSSVWMESAATRLVWITLLAAAEQHGFVNASLPGLAHLARVTMAECEEAIATLAAPDPHSKNEAHEGRRIEKVEAGWLILNYERYREFRTDQQIAEAEKKRRQRLRGDMSGDIGDTSRDIQEKQKQKSERDTERSKEEAEEAASAGRQMLLDALPETRRAAFAAKIRMLAQGIGLPGGVGVPTPEQVDAACLDLMASTERGNATPKALVAFLTREMRGDAVRTSPNGRKSFLDEIHAIGEGRA